MDLDAFAANVRRIRGMLHPRVKLLLAVKKNAYGHGLVTIGKAAQRLGVDWLGVFSAGEGVRLRAAGLRAPILVFSTTPGEEVATALKNRLTLTITNAFDAQMVEKSARKLNVRAPVHLKLDTGMGRLGFGPSAVLSESLPGMLKCRHVFLQGAYSHLACADSSLEYSRRQLATLLDFVRRAPCSFEMIHLGASSTLPMAEFHLDMVRVGIAAYGGHHSLPGFRSVLRVRAPILQVKNVPRGTRISYGGTFQTKRRSRIAVIGAGYGDGYLRSLSNRGWVFVRGRRAPIVGRVCMDQFMVDVTRIPGVARGETAELIGPKIEAARLAEAAGTISYELLCSLGGARLP